MKLITQDIIFVVDWFISNHPFIFGFADTTNRFWIDTTKNKKISKILSIERKTYISTLFVTSREWKIVLAFRCDLQRVKMVRCLQFIWSKNQDKKNYYKNDENWVPVYFTVGLEVTNIRSFSILLCKIWITLRELCALTQ